jgi:hypothetical protein
MKKITALVAASALMTSVAAGAFAGGLEDPAPVPVPVIVDEPSTSLSTGAIVAGLAAIALIAVIANSSGSSSSSSATTTNN